MRRPIATVLAGPSTLLREGLTRILDEVDFRVIASAACVDDGFLLAVPQDRPILLIIDAGDDLSAVVPQVALFKERRLMGVSSYLPITTSRMIYSMFFRRARTRTSLKSRLVMRWSNISSS